MEYKTQEALKMAIVAMDTWKDIDVLKARKMCKEALAQPAQEPVGYTTEFDLETALEGNTLLWFANKNGKYNIPLYTHPAPSWQGLSDDEIEEIIVGKNGTYFNFACAIEQALKEKNHGI